MSIIWGSKNNRVRLVSRSAMVMFYLVCLGCFLNQGCRYAVQSNNPEVIMANDLLTAAEVTDLVATGLVDANRVIEQLQTQEPDYYAKTKPVLKQMAKLNDSAISAIRDARTGGTADWRGALVAVSRGIQISDLTEFGFKNPNTQAIVKIGMASLVAVLQSIPNSFGGKLQ